MKPRHPHNCKHTRERLMWQGCSLSRRVLISMCRWCSYWRHQSWHRNISGDLGIRDQAESLHSLAWMRQAQKHSKKTLLALEMIPLERSKSHFAALIASGRNWLRAGLRKRQITDDAWKLHYIREKYGIWYNPSKGFSTEVGWFFFFLFQI